MDNSRKSTRLSPAKHLGTQFYFVTICCDHRRPHLADQFVATLVLSTLQECAVQQGSNCMPIAACQITYLSSPKVSPLGPICAIESASSNSAPPSNSANRTKRRSGKMNYYDHILRSQHSAERLPPL
jgi:hypothetical protein